ncbi:DUF2231 domain-containing protein [Dactylosporangium matsuzakiense]|uniref:DUF2231 domain-containing protein n=1 Tax=Dactylosporangium matsuzakiense TaxID=53360 RepID=A0A9W6NJV9_9ACTN|nr:DUF2231 domain-containing protein [Dactylosporangium matsuzakiense]UWZ45658.1 hypothetical protein Dmats_03820 [Dactylosporangium matsuzakiense]GLL00325.1 hypothetical protein GCM10017581_020650 [Dactylosporangium matsuzakiense]
MFDRVSGIPAHPLFVHGAVVLVPLLALVAVLYGVWPGSRRHIRWPLIAFAVAAPIAVFVSKESGEELSKQFGDSPAVAAHEEYADKLFWFILALAVVSLVMAFMVPVTRESTAAVKAPVVAHYAVAALAVVLAVVSAFYVYKTGDSGAHMVWGA